jgi:hypothetical protein
METVVNMAKMLKADLRAGECAGLENFRKIVLAEPALA